MIDCVDATEHWWSDLVQAFYLLPCNSVSIQLARRKRTKWTCAVGCLRLLEANQIMPTDLRRTHTRILVSDSMFVKWQSSAWQVILMSMHNILLKLLISDFYAIAHWTFLASDLITQSHTQSCEHQRGKRTNHKSIWIYQFHIHKTICAASSAFSHTSTIKGYIQLRMEQ